jgi:Protein of unknown function (DUF2838)
MATAPFWRTADKIGFVLGTIILVSYSYMIGKYPNDHFYTYYLLTLIPLLIMRYFHYYSRGWHYYITDFCYFANILLIYVIMYDSKNEKLIKITYLFSQGAIANAIWMFRNSLVLHKIDMLTSLAIHIMPMTMTYHIRWITIPE